MGNQNYTHAGFGIRLLAAIIDGIIFGVIYWPIELAVGVLFFGNYEIYSLNQLSPFGDPQYLILSNLLSTVLGWLYFSYFFRQNGEPHQERSYLNSKWLTLP